MIVIDTSAVIAIVLGEIGAARLADRIEDELAGDRLMSAAGYVEAGTVLAGRHASPQRGIDVLDEFVATVGIDIIPVDEAQARLALAARIKFGRGFSAPAKLNYGDSFSYALAKSLDAPLLFIGNDFTATDIASALPAS